MRQNERQLQKAWRAFKRQNVARRRTNSQNKQPPHKPNPRLSVYYERTVNVRALGFKNYTEYLKSDLWASIRDRVLQRARGACELCKRKASTQVHHTSYAADVLRGENTTPLVACCGRCHYMVEFRGKKKRSFYGVTQSTESRLNAEPSPLEDALERELDEAIRLDSRHMGAVRSVIDPATGAVE